MHPPALPQYIRDNPLREAECEVYDALDSQLDDLFHVFYSSPWIGVTPDGREIDGEADFTVAHPEMGMLVIEVKGGGISVSDETKKWQSTDRHNITRNIKNPVSQAKGGKYNLLEKLKGRVEWTPRFIKAVHGVILPDCKRASHDLGPDMPLSIFAFEDDMRFLDAWVKSRLSYTEPDGADSGNKPLGIDGIHALEALLSKGFKLRVSLDRVLDKDRADIQRLTEEQLHILNELEDNARMAIAGAAGTGKTVLAVRKAEMLLENEINTLLVCYNEALARHLRRRLSECAGISVYHFHDLCRDLAGEAGLEVPESSGQGRKYYDVTLPELMVDALARMPLKRFEAIIVDEGQDFADNWLECLEIMLADRESGTFYVFYDNNQRVSQRGRSFIATMPAAKYRLTRNFRNTRNIFDVSSRFYAGGIVLPIGPEGQVVKYVRYKNPADDIKTLKAELGVLIKQDKIPAEHIAVLVTDGQALNRVGNSGMIGQFKAVRAPDVKPGYVTLETIRRFKGLDSPVVILFRPEDYLDEPELLYVGITRAQVKLIIVGSMGAVGFLEQKASQG